MLNAHNIGHTIIPLPEDMSLEALKNEIEVYNRCPETCGILLQLPLPPKFRPFSNEVVNKISRKNK